MTLPNTSSGKTRTESLRVLRTAMRRPYLAAFLNLSYRARSRFTRNKGVREAERRVDNWSFYRPLDVPDTGVPLAPHLSDRGCSVSTASCKDDVAVSQALDFGRYVGVATLSGGCSVAKRANQMLLGLGDGELHSLMQRGLMSISRGIPSSAITTLSSIRRASQHSP